MANPKAKKELEEQWRKKQWNKWETMVASLTEALWSENNACVDGLLEERDAEKAWEMLKKLTWGDWLSENKDRSGNTKRLETWFRFGDYGGLNWKKKRPDQRRSVVFFLLAFASWPLDDEHDEVKSTPLRVHLMMRHLAFFMTSNQQNAAKHNLAPWTTGGGWCEDALLAAFFSAYTWEGLDFQTRKTKNQSHSLGGSWPLFRPVRQRAGVLVFLEVKAPRVVASDRSYTFSLRPQKGTGDRYQNNFYGRMDLLILDTKKSPPVEHGLELKAVRLDWSDKKDDVDVVYQTVQRRVRQLKWDTWWGTNRGILRSLLYTDNFQCKNQDDGPMIPLHHRLHLADRQARQYYRPSCARRLGVVSFGPFVLYRQEEDKNCDPYIPKSTHIAAPDFFQPFDVMSRPARPGVLTDHYLDDQWDAENPKMEVVDKQQLLVNFTKMLFGKQSRGALKAALHKIESREQKDVPPKAMQKDVPPKAMLLQRTMSRPSVSDSHDSSEDDSKESNASTTGGDDTSTAPGGDDTQGTSVSDSHSTVSTIATE